MTWHRPFGTSSRDGWDVVIEPDSAGWEHTALYAAELAPGDQRALAATNREHIVVPLSGSVTVTSDDGSGMQVATLAGRASVFSGPTDVAYVPARSRLTVRAEGAARVAVVGAVTGKSPARRQFRHVAVDEVPVEVRGAGMASREVRNFGTPAVLDADSIIACEVVTPSGNWSSWPSHKHDEEREGEETQLEEIYYFEVSSSGHLGRGAPRGLGYLAVGGVGVVAEVGSGDVVLVPHGWHGPAMAPPGYDVYYLNVMAGPGPERAWRICDDPNHAWVREGWPNESVDPRLTYRGDVSP
jgi:5-deoxy-glucuronate isomerase